MYPASGASIRPRVHWIRDNGSWTVLVGHMGALSETQWRVWIRETLCGLDSRAGVLVLGLLRRRQPSKQRQWIPAMPWKFSR